VSIATTVVDDPDQAGSTSARSAVSEIDITGVCDRIDKVARRPLRSPAPRT
jgi:hypothetical protein